MPLWVPAASSTPADNSVTSAKILDGEVALADLANLATARLLGRATAGTGVPEALTAAQAKALLAITSADLSDFSTAARSAAGTNVDNASGSLYLGGDVLSGAPFDYEFTGDTTSLPSGWSWYNQGTATYNEKFGVGAIKHPNGAGEGWKGIVHAIPSASAFTIDAKILNTSKAAAASHTGGLFVTDGTKTVVFWQSYDSGIANPYRTVRLEKWTNATTFSAAFGSNFALHDLPPYMRITKASATSWSCQVSFDGANWLTTHSGHDFSAFLTPTHYGFAGYNTQSVTGAATACEWVRVR